MAGKVDGKGYDSPPPTTPQESVSGTAKPSGGGGSSKGTWSEPTGPNPGGRGKD